MLKLMSWLAMSTMLLSCSSTSGYSQQAEPPNMPPEWEEVLGPDILGITTYDTNGVQTTYKSSRLTDPLPLQYEPDIPAPGVDATEIKAVILRQRAVVYIDFEGGSHHICFPPCYPAPH